MRRKRANGQYEKPPQATLGSLNDGFGPTGCVVVCVALLSAPPAACAAVLAETWSARETLVLGAH